MILLVSVCNIPWWAVLLATLVPAVLGWMLANEFAKSKNKALRDKIKQLRLELKECYEDKQIITTNLIKPEVKFSDADKSQSKKDEKSVKASKSPGFTLTSSPKIRTSKPDEIQENGIGDQGFSNPQNQKEQNPRSQTTSKLKYPKLKDNLEIVEGIGPKMSKILGENDIKTWSNLATTTPKALKAVLNKYGDRYRIIDPSNWPDQAGLAKANQWEKLIEIQKENSKNGGSKVSKLLIKYGYARKFKQDDLKAIEGIGPKTAELLKTKGIQTWNQLANTKLEVLQKILSEAGKRYQLVKPDSWAAQARLAADGNFSGLEQLQSKLNAGK